MKLIVIAFVSGILFGLGLMLSQMTNPNKVINFLDISGNWDPSLILVMAGALTVTSVFFRIVLKRQKPLFDKQFYLASKTAIDKPLLLGATFFGIGWGISGYCPGPSVAALGLGNPEAIVMVVAIYSGFICHRFLTSK